MLALSLRVASAKGRARIVGYACRRPATTLLMNTLASVARPRRRTRRHANDYRRPERTARGETMEDGASLEVRDDRAPWSLALATRGPRAGARYPRRGHRAPGNHHPSPGLGPLGTAARLGHRLLRPDAWPAARAFPDDGPRPHARGHADARPDRDARARHLPAHARLGQPRQRRRRHVALRRRRDVLVLRRRRQLLGHAVRGPRRHRPRAGAPDRPARSLRAPRRRR